MGGALFSLNMLSAQVMPFVALWMYKMEEREEGVSNNTHSELMESNTIGIFLVCSFVLWLVLNILFLCTIDLSYMHTFFDLKTGPEYTVERYLTTTEDHIKFDAVFMNRLSFTKTIHEEVKTWIEKNFDRWRDDKPEWLKMELIDDEFLPARAIAAEGGANRRRRSSISFKELVVGVE